MILPLVLGLLSLAPVQDKDEERTRRILERIDKEFKESRTRLREEIRAIIREEVGKGSPRPAPETPPPVARKKVYLGVVAGDLTDEERKASGGIKVAEARGPAQKAGMKPGDILVALDGKPVSEETILEILDARKPGDTVEATVVRNGKREALKIVLAERKD